MFATVLSVSRRSFSSSSSSHVLSNAAIRSVAPAALHPSSAINSHYQPPTPQQLQQLRIRLLRPYASGPSPTSLSVPKLDACRLLSLDVGDRYVGVAVSDANNTTAVPLTTVHRRETASAPVGYHSNLSPHAHVASSSSSSSRKYVDYRSSSTSSGNNHNNHNKKKVFARDRNPAVVAEEVRALLAEYQCAALVVGMPLTLSFEMGIQCAKTQQFVSQLQTYFAENATKPVLLPPADSARSSTPRSVPFTVPALFWWDERLTSADARQQLANRGLSRQKIALQTDPVAAATILQEFLNRLKDL